MPIRAMIFDMDGVLVDSEPIHFKTNILFWKNYGKRFTRTHIRKYLGVRASEEIADLAKNWRISQPVEGLVAEREALFFSLMRKSLGLSTGAKSLLRLLKDNNVLIGIGTSSQKQYVDFVLDRFKLRPYFQSVVTAEHVQYGKPNPEIYRKVSESLKVHVSQCVVLEDAVHGVAAAKAAGMTCFAIPNLFGDTKAYSQADRIFASLTEVTEYLLKTRSFARY